MDHASPAERSLFDAGPPLRLQQALGLCRPAEPRLARRIVLALLIGWAPLALLSVFQGLAVTTNRWEACLLDWGAYARWWIAVPLLIAAEGVCIPWMGRIARHFLAAGLVSEPDRPRYEAAMASARRQLDSAWPEILVIGLAYLSAFAWNATVTRETSSTWQAPLAPGGRALSLAGWWHLLVSQPLFLALLYGWLWRVVVWALFLRRVARLDLKLVASHPDGVGGLAFVRTSMRAFATLAFALGAVAAGGMANRIHYGGVPPQHFKYVLAILVALNLLLFAGPLLVFSDRLRRAKWEGVMTYGALAQGMGQQLERKWLQATDAREAEALGAPDFSATVDLYGIVANARGMKLSLCDYESLVFLVAATLLPFLPVLLTVIPLEQAVKELVKLLI
jgi:hypothetical protein